MILICALGLGICEFGKKRKTKIFAGICPSFPFHPGQNSLEIYRVCRLPTISVNLTIRSVPVAL
jgi:hypothetical protein